MWLATYPGQGSCYQRPFQTYQYPPESHPDLSARNRPNEFQTQTRSLIRSFTTTLEFFCTFGAYPARLIQFCYLTEVMAFVPVICCVKKSCSSGHFRKKIVSSDETCLTWPRISNRPSANASRQMRIVNSWDWVVVCSVIIACHSTSKPKRKTFKVEAMKWYAGLVNGVRLAAYQSLCYGYPPF